MIVCSSLFFVLHTKVAQVCTQVYPPRLKIKTWNAKFVFLFHSFQPKIHLFFSFFLNFFYQSPLKWQNYFSICYLCFEFKKKNKEIILASYAPFQLHMFERSWKKVYENCLNWCRVLGSDELVSHVNYILEELKSPAKHV